MRRRLRTQVASVAAVRSHPASFYVHALKPRLNSILSVRARSRLAWLPVHVAIIVTAMIAIADNWLPWPVDLMLSVAIGLAFGGLMFLGHETMHGAVVRGRRARSLVGTICFAPLCLSPRLWSVWHNRVHHANTNRIGADPDMYPTLAEYHANAAARFAADNFALGGKRWRGVLCLVAGFTGQSSQILLFARSRMQISRRDHRIALLHTATLVAGWVALAFVIGPAAFVFAYLVPVVIANILVMSFIVTNHGLSPANDDNDPLLSSLSVTIPRWAEWLTLDFGYHTEHHLFPAASGRHLRTVRAALVETWPERYQSLPLGTALARLYATGRVYQDATTLVDPRTGGAWQTIVPRESARDARKIEGEHAADTRNVARRDGAADRNRALLTDRQPESHAAPVLRPLLERAE